MLNLPVEVTRAVKELRDVQEIEGLLEEELMNIPGEVQPHLFWSLLMSVAAHYEHYDLLRELIHKGHDVNDKFSQVSWPLPLHIALFGKKDVKFIVLLLEAGANVNIRANCTISLPLQIFSAIEVAMINDNVDILELLFPRYIPEMTAKESGLLHLACLHGAVNCLKYLIVRVDKHNINKQSAAENTPLIYAVRHGGELVEIMLENGADVNMRNKSGMTAVHMAVRQLGGRALIPGHLTQTITLLLDAGADVNSQDKDGETVFGLTCAQSQRQTWQNFKKLEDLRRLEDHTATVENTIVMLLARGANVHSGKKCFGNAIHTSIKSVIRSIAALNSANADIHGRCIVSALRLINSILNKVLQSDTTCDFTEDGVTIMDLIWMEMYESGAVITSYRRANWYASLIQAFALLLQTFLNHGGHISQNLSLACHFYLLYPEQNDQLLTIMWQSLDELRFRENILHFNLVRNDETNKNLSVESRHNGVECILEKYSKNPRTLTEISRSKIFKLLRTPQKYHVSLLPGPKRLGDQILCSSTEERY